MIDILIPSVGRSQVLAPLVGNIQAATQGDFLITFVLDNDDEASLISLCALNDPSTRWIWFDGTYPEKTNAGYRATEGALVLPTADDVRFHPGWLGAALNALSDPSVQVLGTDDLSPATADRDHATMPIIRRSYIEERGAAWGETGTIFHEGYRHNFCETETWQLALHRGVTAWAEGCVIEHLHPAWGKREADETDRKGNQTGWEKDELLFRRRMRKWSRS